MYWLLELTSQIVHSYILCCQPSICHEPLIVVYVLHRYNKDVGNELD
ncbi:hypothetical protein J7E52_18265 [Bacillus sp. ISL-34]|nr:hypothetical protein [Bacillus sp. ISL-34]MBT2648618.1 hypothetical protein [Bacillus sp. ISL-34]